MKVTYFPTFHCPPPNQLEWRRRRNKTLIFPTGSAKVYGYVVQYLPFIVPTNLSVKGVLADDSHDMYLQYPFKSTTSKKWNRRKKLLCQNCCNWYDLNQMEHYDFIKRDQTAMYTITSLSTHRPIQTEKKAHSNFHSTDFTVFLCKFELVTTAMYEDTHH